MTPRLPDIGLNRVTNTNRTQPVMDLTPGSIPGTGFTMETDMTSYPDNQVVEIYHPAEIHVVWTCENDHQSTPQYGIPYVGYIEPCTTKPDKGGMLTFGQWSKWVPCGKPCTVKKYSIRKPEL